MGKLLSALGVLGLLAGTPSFAQINNPAGLSIVQPSSIAPIAPYTMLSNNSGSTASPAANSTLVIGCAPVTLVGLGASFCGSVSTGYVQVMVQNTATAGQSGYTATANDGTDSTHYLWIGMNNSTGPAASNTFFTNAHAASHYTTDSELDIGALGAGGIINFYTSQYTTANAYVAYGLVVGSPIIGDKGIGSINAVTMYQNGLGIGAAPVGYPANLKGSSAGSVQTASWTADLLSASTTLGGTTYSGGNLSLSFNGAGTGANGMDTGAMPSSGALYIYAIYNPAGQTWATLGTVSGTGATIYPGSNMPSGYTASALLWSGETTGTNFVAFVQRGRKVATANIVISNTLAGQTTATAQSIALAVPPNAIFVSGILSQVQPAGGGQTLVVSANGTVGTQEITGTTAGLATTTGVLTFKDVPITTAQTISYLTGNSVASSTGLFVIDYTF